MLGGNGVEWGEKGRSPRTWQEGVERGKEKIKGERLETERQSIPSQQITLLISTTKPMVSL